MNRHDTTAPFEKKL